MKPFTSKQTSTIKKKWDRLQGSEHGIDFERAKVLHKVFLRNDRDEGLLKEFMVSVLGEYPGKRTTKFIHFVRAFETISDSKTWTTVGGSGVVKLARLNKTKRKKVMARVCKVLKSTKRETISHATLRNVMIEALTESVYLSTLTEHHIRGDGISKSAQLRALKSFVIRLMGEFPEVRDYMPQDVAEAVGADLVD